MLSFQSGDFCGCLPLRQLGETLKLPALHSGNRSSTWSIPDFFRGIKGISYLPRRRWDLRRGDSSRSWLGRKEYWDAAYASGRYKHTYAPRMERFNSMKVSMWFSMVIPACCSCQRHFSTVMFGTLVWLLPEHYSMHREITKQCKSSKKNMLNIWQNWQVDAWGMESDLRNHLAVTETDVTSCCGSFEGKGNIIWGRDLPIDVLKTQQQQQVYVFNWNSWFPVDLGHRLRMFVGGKTWIWMNKSL